MDKIEDKLWNKVFRYSWIFNLAPFVKGVFVCNSLAFGTATVNSDIDIFVVTKRNRLYIARFYLNFLLKIFGQRTYGKKTAGRFCLSFFVDEDEMNLTKFSKSNDYYLAYWIYSLKPIVDRNFVSRFASKNKWALNLVNKDNFDYQNEDFRSHPVSNFFRRVKEVCFFGFIGNFFEYLFRKFVNNSDHSNPCIHISPKVFKFHLNDRRIYFRDSYIKQFGKNFNESHFLSLLQDSHGNQYL